MFRLLITLVLVALPPASSRSPEPLPLSRADAKHLVDSISVAYYDSKFAIYPAYATSKGIHSHDSTLSTFPPIRVRKFLLQTKGMLRDLAAFSDDSLDIQTWVDMKALVADMETQVFMIEDLEMWKRSPILYTDACTDGLYYLAIRDENFRANPAFTARVATIPKVFESARKNLARPIKLHCEVASASLDAFLPFLQSLVDSTDQSGQSLSQAAREACDAFRQFKAYLDSVSATADPDFALGYDNFVRLLKTEHLVDESPEDIVAYAERVLNETKARRAALPPAATPAQNPSQSDSAAAARLTKTDILAAFSAEAESAEAFLERNAIVTVPHNTRVKAVETPSFIKVLVPGYAYEPPGPFDLDQQGLLYVPLPSVLDAKARMDYEQRIAERRFKGIVVHELYPGHHLQLTTANSVSSYIRKLQEDNFTVEGWALYCEQMMAEQGYLGPDGERRALGGIIFRAARVIVDVKLQLGEFSLSQAVDFMVSEAGMDRESAQAEVRRYAVEPTQPMSYLIGKREITLMRDEFKRIKGSGFTLKEFHDSLLAGGSLPPYLLRVSVFSRLTGRQ